MQKLARRPQPGGHLACACSIFYITTQRMNGPWSKSVVKARELQKQARRSMRTGAIPRAPATRQNLLLIHTPAYINVPRAGLIKRVRELVVGTSKEILYGHCRVVSSNLSPETMYVRIPSAEANNYFWWVLGPGLGLPPFNSLAAAHL